MSIHTLSFNQFNLVFGNKSSFVNSEARNHFLNRMDRIWQMVGKPLDLYVSPEVQSFVTEILTTGSKDIMGPMVDYLLDVNPDVLNISRMVMVVSVLLRIRQWARGRMKDKYNHLTSNMQVALNKLHDALKLMWVGILDKLHYKQLHYDEASW
jgi:hypothetical protein